MYLKYHWEGDSMRRLMTKVMIVLGGLAAAFGISISNVHANKPTPIATEINKITETSPLYLDHSVNIFSVQIGDQMSWHYSHSSHESHWSHQSHHSHHSHYSGY